jgi:hypothetical protein
MRRRRKTPRLSQQDLRAAGATPGRLATRYSPAGRQAEVRQLTAEAIGLGQGQQHRTAKLGRRRSH